MAVKEWPAGFVAGPSFKDLVWIGARLNPKLNWAPNL